VLSQSVASTVVCMCWYSWVGIATGYGLEGPGAGYSALVHTGTGDLQTATHSVQGLSGVKRPVRGVDRTDHLAARAKKA
jgi:hypothetical protein